MGIDVMCGPRDLVGEADVLYRNNGDGTFTDVTAEAGIVDPGSLRLRRRRLRSRRRRLARHLRGQRLGAQPPVRNNRNGTFSEIGLVVRRGAERRRQGAGRHGRRRRRLRRRRPPGHVRDEFLRRHNTLYQNGAEGFFSDVSHRAGVGHPSLPYLGWGTGFADFDNDGLLDIFVANGHVYPEIDRFGLGRNTSSASRCSGIREGPIQGSERGCGRRTADREIESRRRFRGLSTTTATSTCSSINMNDRPTLLRNETGAGQPLDRAEAGRGRSSNRDAIGARVWLEDEGSSRSRKCAAAAVIYRITTCGSVRAGPDDRRRRLWKVRWPDGAVERFEGLPPNAIHAIRQGQGRAGFDRLP